MVLIFFNIQHITHIQFALFAFCGKRFFFFCMLLHIFGIVIDAFLCFYFSTVCLFYHNFIVLEPCSVKYMYSGCFWLGEQHLGIVHIVILGKVNLLSV